MSGGGRASGRAGSSSARAGGAKGRREQYGASGGMATLKGSEKQIEWASNLRNTVNEALDDSIAYMQKQVPSAGADVVKQGIDRAKRVKSVVNSTSSASEIIDTFSGHIGKRTGEDAKQAALTAISRSVTSGVEAMDKRLKKAWNG